MAIQIGHWERRDGANREAMARAALDLCRASRAIDGIRGSRFYWQGADTIVIQSDAESFEVFDKPANAASAKAVFTMADLARQVGGERWSEPRSGEEVYRLAGR